jgi:uncharacterized protein
MAASVDIRVGSHAMLAFGERGLFWPKHRRLLIADLHLGKGDEFRRAGIALPSGGTSLDLDRLSGLIEASGAREVWVLGDFLHGSADSAQWRSGWAAWRRLNRALRVGVLAGNHDRALAAAGLDVDLLGTTVDEEGLAFRHVPTPLPQVHVVCGHLHPVVRLPGLRGRWPIFWQRDAMTILPAFSRFSGGFLVEPAPHESYVACVHGEVALAQADSDAS